VDAYSRVTCAEVKRNERRKESAVAFLRSALCHYRRLGIQMSGGMTDNARVFQSERFQRVLRWLGLKYKTTRPYTPRTNVRLERFIRTLLSERAYAHAYRSSDERDAYLPRCLYYYNWHRSHTSLNYQAPFSRLGLRVNNVVTKCGGFKKF